jgi:phosphoglycerate dehydrogenase-like enzyme
VEASQITLFVRAAGGADVDVFDPELPAPPTFVQSSVQFAPDPQSPLIDLPNVVLTQHNAGFTHQAISRMVRATIAGI